MDSRLCKLDTLLEKYWEIREQYAHVHRQILKSYLVDLPIGAISNKLHQLKDTSWVLREREGEEWMKRRLKYGNITN